MAAIWAHQPYSQLSKGNQTFDDLLRICWPNQFAWDCLRAGPCSWCPASGTCVPNTYKIPILAPIYDPDICPLWSERWELRAMPLGPWVSTITFLTCIISVLSTFVVIGLVAAGVKAVRTARAHWQARSDDWWRLWKHYDRNWWRGWRLVLRDKLESRSNPDENTPLLV